MFQEMVTQEPCSCGVVNSRSTNLPAMNRITQFSEAWNRLAFKFNRAPSLLMKLKLKKQIKDNMGVSGENKRS